MRPNCADEALELGTRKFGLLKTLKASALNWMETRSVMAVSFNIPTSVLKNLGPRMMLRPELPKVRANQQIDRMVGSRWTLCFLLTRSHACGLPAASMSSADSLEWRLGPVAPMTLHYAVTHELEAISASGGRQNWPGIPITLIPDYVGLGSSIRPCEESASPDHAPRIHIAVFEALSLAIDFDVKPTARVFLQIVVKSRQYFVTEAERLLAGTVLRRDAVL